MRKVIYRDPDGNEIGSGGAPPSEGRVLAAADPGERSRPQRGMRVRGLSPPPADLRRFGPVRDNSRVVISYNFSSAARGVAM